MTERDASSIFDHIQVGASAPLVSPAETARATGMGGGPASTGLVAALAREEFERLLHQSGRTTVLRIPVRLAAASERQRVTGFRYVTVIDGIIFVATVAQALNFGADVREIVCLGVSHEGRPLGRDETAV